MPIKIIKWFAIAFAALVAALAVLALALPFFFPLDRIKDFAADRIAEAIQREVKIERISINLFSGIRLEKISIGNPTFVGKRKGFSNQPFISAESLELHSAFWPIIKNQLVIKEIVLVKPRVWLENKGGKFNLWTVKTTAGKEGQQNPKKGFSVLINSFRVQDAQVDYFDRKTKTVIALKNVNLALSGILLALAKPLDLKLSAVVEYQQKKIPFSLSSKVRIDLPKEKFSLPALALRIAGEPASLDVAVSFSKKQMFLTIKQMAMYGGVLSGSALINLAAPEPSYRVNNLKLRGVDSAPLVNALTENFLPGLPDYKDLLDKVYGKLQLTASFSSRGIGVDAFFANAAGRGSFVLAEGKVKRPKTLAALEEALKSNLLQSDIKFNTIRSKFTFQSRVITAEDFSLEAGEIKVGFDGAVNLANQTWVAGNRLKLRLSPGASQGLPNEFNLFRDDKSWFTLDFEMTGPLKKPLPKPILDQPIEAVIGKFKIKIDAKKIEIEQKAPQVFPSPSR